MRYNYICIEGTIGVGKTTLASLLAQEYSAKLILEQFEDNPFLSQFYRDPDKYAFPLELSFLASRYHQLKAELLVQDMFKSFTVADYFIDKSLIFATQTIHDDELTLFRRLFDIIISNLPRPNLLVYLYMPVNRLLENIRLRGRPYESGIKPAYLETIQKGYLDYISHHGHLRILIINMAQLDFVSTRKDYDTLRDLIFRDYATGLHRIGFE
jgi:deoxyadenosine/deoxycytidine kinase